MNNYSRYDLETLCKMCETAYYEERSLAIRPCTNPATADLAPLEKATAKYEAICEELKKRGIEFIYVSPNWEEK